MTYPRPQSKQINLSVESVLQPIEKASGLPNQAYTSASFFEHERDQVLARSWAGLWFASDLPKKGYVKPVEFMGLPLVIMRTKNDEIKVFHNVCSHRGMILVNKEGPVQGALRCPYHSWSYSLDGELKATPHLGGVGQHKTDGFNHCDHGLKPVRCAVWMDIIFINLAGDAEDFTEYVKPLTDRWQSFLGNTGLDRVKAEVEGDGMEIEVRSNWKLAIENFCESYHLPWIHPGLNTYSRLEDHYHIMIGENFGGQGSYAYRLSNEAGAVGLPRFPEWPEDKLEEAEYVAFYPNVLLGIQADHTFAMIIEPLACDKSLEHVRLYYVGEEAIGEHHSTSRKANLESWGVVFTEDIDAVEGMQKGRSSPGYQGGVFSPVMDNPTHHFHQWVARKLRIAT
ncbi:MAG: aromatic ring-hydroxylating dioxygenase subunit alpha [Gammaproteobacteria bacterium]